MSDSHSWASSTMLDVEVLKKLLLPLGYTLEQEQPHISGERFLMTKDKLVLTGTQQNSKKVIIKAAKQRAGREEIMRERKIHDALSKAAFGSGPILLPVEVYFGETHEYLLWITEFIDQDTVFAARPLDEQFFLALKAFEIQEAFQANTFENIKTIKDSVPIYKAQQYLQTFADFNMRVSGSLSQAEEILRRHEHIIEKYCGYLTHTDLAPANIRVHGREIYFIDLSSMLFGNKYEGWARFINWSVVHSPALEPLLLDYVKVNRGEEEYLCLRLMRIYKIGFLIDYYTQTLAKSSGSLRTLNEKRARLWLSILEYVLRDEKIPEEMLESYRSERNRLRSSEEMERQKEINIATL